MSTESKRNGSVFLFRKFGMCACVPKASEISENMEIYNIFLHGENNYFVSSNDLFSFVRWVASSKMTISTKAKI
jgi:hypothetical protein